MVRVYPGFSSCRLLLPSIFFHASPHLSHHHHHRHHTTKASSHITCLSFNPFTHTTTLLQTHTQTHKQSASVPHHKRAAWLGVDRVGMRS